MHRLQDQTARMQGYSKNEKESDGQKRETGGEKGFECHIWASGSSCFWGRGMILPRVPSDTLGLADLPLFMWLV